MKTIQDAIAKAAKLLKLAQSDNVNEAAVAAAKAQAIIDEFKLNPASLSDVDDVADEVPDEDIVDFKQKGAPLDAASKLATWKKLLALAVGKANQCEVFTSYGQGGRTIEIIGRPSDVDVVRYLYAYLLREVDRLCKKEGKGCGATWRNNFRLGAVEVLDQRLAAQLEETKQRVYEQAQGDCTALVRVDNAIAKLERNAKEVQLFVKRNYKLRSSTANYQGHAGGRAAGRKAGAGIALGARGALNG